MSSSPCTKRSHAPYTAASFALRDTDSSRWTPVTETAFDRLDAMADTPGARVRVLRVCLHRPLVTIETIFTYLHGPQGFSARRLEDGLVIRRLVEFTQASKGLQDP